MEIYKKLYIYLLYISYILYFIIVFNLYNKAPYYLNYLNEYIKYYTILFILYNYNPYSKHKFDSFDKKIIFNSALFLLSTTSLTNIMLYKLKTII